MKTHLPTQPLTKIISFTLKKIASNNFKSFWNENKGQEGTVLTFYSKKYIRNYKFLRLN